jgi:hypothetical protein
LDPFDILNQIAKNNSKILIDYKNLIHEEYLTRRKKILEFIRNLSIFQNFDEETYFQTIFYTDKCILSENFSSLFNKNNLNISEFLLNFIKNNTIDYDYLFLSIVLGCFSLASKIINFSTPFFFILIY